MNHKNNDKTISTPGMYNAEILNTLKSIETQIRRLNRLSLFTNFVQGLFYGLGFVFGTTVLLAIVLASLQNFLTVPVVGDYIKQIIEVVEGN